MKKYIYPISKIYSYCLIPNHFHWLVQIRDEVSLLRIMEVKLPPLKKTSIETFVTIQFSHFFNAFAKWHNLKYKRKGRLFIQSFKRKHINSDEYFTQIINYIHRNPVHHQIVNSRTQWKHSSYNLLASNSKTFLEREQVLEWFGGIEGFKNYHDIAFSEWIEELEEI